MKVKARYEETVILEGWTRKGTDLFTEKKEMLKPIVYHYFTFVFDKIKYEFKVFDNDQKLTFQTNEEVTVLFDNITKNECTFLNEKHRVILWEPDDE